MKKSITIIYISTILFSCDCFSQWSHSEPLNNLNLVTGGNVGIGTANPLSTINNKGLHISQGDHTSLLLGSPTTNGFGGIVQTSDNRHRIFIGANMYDDPIVSWKNFQQNKGSAGISILADEGSWGTGIDFYTSTSNTPIISRLRIDGNGNVGIGTESPDAKLTVKGHIHTNEVLVDLNGAVAPDYVFKKDYPLLSLSELEIYINQNKHLPEVPSAKEMEASGFNLKEMNLLLLKKVEELTVHLIEQNKINQAQQQENNQIIKEIECLKNKK